MAGKSRRGFASMDPARQREIASKGGRAAHAKGTAHEWSAEEARVAGKKGGEVVSRDRAHMAAIGREGGEARGRKRQQRPDTVGDRETPMAVGNENGGRQQEGGFRRDEGGLRADERSSENGESSRQRESEGVSGVDAGR